MSQSIESPDANFEQTHKDKVPLPPKKRLRFTVPETDFVPATTADPVTLSTADPVTVSTADPVTVSTADPVTVSTADPVTVSTADPVTVSTADPVAVSTADPVTAQVTPLATDLFRDSLADSLVDPLADPPTTTVTATVTVPIQEADDPVEARRRLVQEIQERDRAIMDMQELAALERRRTRLMYELRYNGSAESGSREKEKQRRKRREQYHQQHRQEQQQQIQRELLGAVDQLNREVLRISTTVLNRAVAAGSPQRSKSPTQRQVPSPSLSGLNIAVSGYDQSGK